MIQVAILEDSRVQRELFSDMVSKHSYADQFIISAFASTSELVEWLSRGHKAHILIADIVLEPQDETSDRPTDLVSTSIDLAKKLLQQYGSTQIIYVSGYDRYHTSVYETNHACFLLKPVNQSEMNFALDQALQRLDQQRRRPLCIRTAGGNRLIDPDAIAFIESRGRKLCFRTKNDIWEAYGKLNNLADNLPSSFVRCHKSFTVNLRFVSMISNTEFKLVTGDTVPISQSKRKATLDAARAYARDTLTR